MMEARIYVVKDEFGDLHSYLGSIGDQLVRLGIIYRRDNEWHIRRADIDIVTEKRMDLSVCDFCSARPVTFDINADSFFNDLNNTHSVGGWTACEDCGVLIEARDEHGLLNRMIDRSLSGEIVREVFAHQQKLFWQHFKSIKRIPPKPFGN